MPVLLDMLNAAGSKPDTQKRDRPLVRLGNHLPDPDGVDDPVIAFRQYRHLRCPPTPGLPSIHMGSYRYCDAQRRRCHFNCHPSGQKIYQTFVRLGSQDQSQWLFLFLIIQIPYNKIMNNDEYKAVWRYVNSAPDFQTVHGPLCKIRRGRKILTYSLEYI